MKKVINLYKNAYGGLSQPAWVLALVMLINRSGSMVVPFLSIYLTSELGYNIKEAGIVLATFGFGSMAGSYLGGWLTDKFGQFRVQFLSLTIGGLMFLVLSQIRMFELFVVWIFLVSLVIDSLRPANAASIALYARPENITRAFSLNRMAINLGFSVGPAIGGLLAAVSYFWLFVADGFTCFLAGFLFYFYFRKRKTYKNEAHIEGDPFPIKTSVWKDGRFLIFSFFVMLFAVCFFQFIFILPLYYRDVYQLSESGIGILLALNGFIVFAFEMVLIYLIGNKIRGRYLITGGVLLTGIAFMMLNLIHHHIWLYISMIVLSFSEIFAMPYMITYTAERSGPKTKGAYMGMYSLSYATAFVFAPLLGTWTIGHLGFDVLWWIIGALAVFTALGFYMVIKPGTAPAPVVEVQ